MDFEAEIDPIIESVEVLDPGAYGSSSMDSTDEDEEPLAYTITWHCKLGKSVIISDSEVDIHQKMSQYFHQILKDKRDRRLQHKLSDGNLRTLLRSCTVTAQTQARVRDVPIMVDEEPYRGGLEWDPVDKQLQTWREKFPGKELRLNIVWEYLIQADDGNQTRVETPEAVPTQTNNPRPNNNSDGVRGSTTVNQLRDFGAEMRNEGASGTRAQVWQAIHSLWICDGRGGCPLNNTDGVCWKNSAQRHFKLLVPEISEWCEAIRQGVEGVTPNCPPQTLIDRLEGRVAAAQTTRKPTSTESSHMPASQIINFYATGHSRPTTPKESEAAVDDQPMSSPDSPGDCLRVEMSLFEYGMWLQESVVSEGWKEDYRRAVCLCIDRRLSLGMAKKKSLSWWEEKGVAEGIARAFSIFTKGFKKAKEEGWTLPGSDVPIEQQMKDWYAGTS